MNGLAGIGKISDSGRRGAAAECAGNDGTADFSLRLQ